MNYCDTSKLFVRQIDKNTAKKMIVKYHYSHLWSPKNNCALGLFYDTGKPHSFFDESEEKLIGVITYGDPVGRHSGISICELLDRTEVYELTRLYVHDGYGSNIESWFISQSFKWLKQNKPKIRALISYASPVEGHLGIVYQATNWIYQGNRIRPNDSWLFRLEKDGDWIHGRTLANTYKTNDIKKLKTKIGRTFWMKKDLRKHRYVYALRDKRKILKNLKYPSLDYPKSIDKEELEIIEVKIDD
jgi:hypothetical protein